MSASCKMGLANEREPRPCVDNSSKSWRLLKHRGPKAAESNKDEGRTAVIKERTSTMSMKAAAPAEATSHWGQQEGVTLW